MTIKDIARECGCGIGTVSRVLNGHPDVSDATREKVRSVVDKYGFVLNQNAKQLKATDSRTIVIIVKGMSSILLNSLLEYIEKKIETLPYNTSVVFLDEYENEAQNALRIYYEQKPMGMIFLGGSPDIYKDDFAKICVPCVLISNHAEDVVSENFSSISTDDVEAAFFCTEYLIKNGHTNIGVIGGDLENSVLSQRRFEGFRKAIEKNGMKFDFNDSYSVAKYSFEGGYNAAEELLEKNPHVTAIFTMADVMAIGACRKLNVMGFKVPEDISVTGFDGLSIAEFYCPKITTIKQLTKRLAEEGLEMLLNKIERKEPAESVHILIPFEFVEGESVNRLI